MSRISANQSVGVFQVFREPEPWKDCLAETGFNSIFCSWNFSKIYLRNPELIVCRQGSNAAVLVLEISNEMAIGVHYGGILTNSGDGFFRDHTCEMINRYLMSRGVKKWSLRMHPFHKTVQMGSLIQSEPLVYVDLSKSLDLIEKAISKQHRRCIRRAQESGLTVHYHHDDAMLIVFYELYQSRQLEKGLVPKDFSFFDQMFKLIGHSLVIVTVSYEGRVVAASLLLNDVDNTFMTYGGMSKEGHRLFSKHLMIYNLIKHFKSTGKSRLILGMGNQRKDPIYQFKKSFTAEETEVATYGIE